MTLEEQDRIEGTNARLLREAKRELRCWQSKATEMGRYLHVLGDILEHPTDKGAWKKARLPVVEQFGGEPLDRSADLDSCPSHEDILQALHNMHRLRQEIARLSALLPTE